MRNYLFRVIAIFLAIAVFSSCEEEEILPEDPLFGPPNVESNTIVLSHLDFLHPNDVKILSADTTNIDVNIDYLLSLEQDIEENDVICFWTSLDSYPFIRKVTKRKNTGNVLTLTTEKADMSMLFKDADVILNSSLKIFDDLAADAELYEKYSYDNEYHPAAIIWEDSISGLKALTAEDLIIRNPNWNIIDSTVYINTKFGNENMSISIKEGVVDINSGIEIYLSIVDHKLRRYECVADGDFNIDTNMQIEGNNNETSGNTSVDSRLTPCTLIFLVGKIPVPVRVETYIMTDINLEKNQPISFSVPLKMESSFKIGSTFRTSWRPTADISTKFHGTPDNVVTNSGLNAKCNYELYFNNNIFIFSDVNTFVKFGHNLSSEWITDDSNVYTSAQFNIGGNTGNDVFESDLWVFYDWQHDFSVVSTELWNKSIPLITK